MALDARDVDDEDNEDDLTVAELVITGAAKYAESG